MGVAVLLTVEEVAQTLRISDQTVVAMCKRGELPAIKVGKLWRIYAEAQAEKLRLPRDQLRGESGA